MFLVVCAAILFENIGFFSIHLWSKERRKRKLSRSHRELLRVIKTIFNLAVLACLIAAVELAIQWNELDDDTNAIDTAAQAIPLVLSAGILVRVVFLHFAGVEEDDDSTTTTTYRTYKRTTVDEVNFQRPPSAHFKA